MFEKLAAKLALNKGGDIIAKVMEGADSLFTSKEEKMKLQNELTEKLNAAQAAENANILETVKAEFENTANARAKEIAIATNENVPLIIKLRSTLIAFFLTVIWGAMTIYVFGTLLNLIKRDANVNFEAVLGLYACLSSQFNTILNFDFGSSTGSHTKQKQLEKIQRDEVFSVSKK